MNGVSVFSHLALMDGSPVPLAKYGGNVTIIVNTASLCSFAASNIRHLTQMQRSWGTRGFTILAFPCSQFANQEPKSAEEISSWVASSGINFPVFDKVKVSGPDAHPLFKGLQSSLGPIRWNYTKFVCSRAGMPYAKFHPTSGIDEVERCVSLLCEE
uniref:Glutathione peroxidase n=1 Tax=Trypanosoma congolense (strain IL3000) TaxID=1068625 RepID=G0V350_TRYCI|nr:unnamed protein product [Trypanosoma congolense IL3000]